MCPWVGPHAPSFGRQLWGLPSRVEYLSPQGVLLPLVYGTDPTSGQRGLKIMTRVEAFTLCPTRFVYDGHSTKLELVTLGV